MVAYPPHLRRTATIALIVGTLLVAINQLDVILRGDADLAVWVKSVTNYIIPFCVSNSGVLAATHRARFHDGSGV